MQLNREWFETKRTLEYFSEKELSMQLGAARSRWPEVLLKELLDNALDACETAKVEPEIGITLSSEGFSVQDNGPGMGPELIEKSLDYTVRVSDKMYYISPSRGQLGNALKCLWAAPYAVNPESPGYVRVTSQGLQHTVRIGVDRIAQEPRIEYHTTPFVRIGTTIEVELALLLSGCDGSRFLQIDSKAGRDLCRVQSPCDVRPAVPRPHHDVRRDEPRLAEVAAVRPNISALVCGGGLGEPARGHAESGATGRTGAHDPGGGGGVSWVKRLCQAKGGAR
jgi:Histidine kinase-, DNA gyrase B-, and HSP90-like ATPase